MSWPVQAAGHNKMLFVPVLISSIFFFLSSRSILSERRVVVLVRVVRVQRSLR